MTLTKSTSQQDPSAGGAGSAGGPVARQEIPVSNVVEAVAAGSSDEEDEEDEAEVDQVCSPTFLLFPIAFSHTFLAQRAMEMTRRVSN